MKLPSGAVFASALFGLLKVAKSSANVEDVEVTMMEMSYDCNLISKEELRLVDQLVHEEYQSLESFYASQGTLEASVKGSGSIYDMRDYFISGDIEKVKDILLAWPRNGSIFDAFSFFANNRNLELIKFMADDIRVLEIQTSALIKEKGLLQSLGKALLFDRVNIARYLI